MTWDRSVSVIANAHCTVCGGRGLKAPGQPCGCVLRAVWCACYARFRQQTAGRFRRFSTFDADFCLVGKRALADSPLELAVFKAHFLLASDWKLCCRQMNIDRGTFFHAVYRVQERLGRVYAELKPYPLYSPREYFGFHLSNVNPCVPVVVRIGPGPLRPPLAQPQQPQASPAPARAHVVPVPVPPIDIAAHVRTRFKEGGSIRSIAADLTRLNVPAPSGERWGISAVRRVLLSKAA